ncbi:hypothetical protein H072_10370 [Dactylellina haptotyla CBS 200.50]|uniref:rRNA methyltransferase 1, mitochondrial n=1 Tax=Dactylellina haptotyla (strain CBS 200.50) TaxID=1284197 RepID=S8BLP8_DACHA|nr:hypothetical protein H072_10370 [Dactylellina haptotyla CBS 200.50]
MKARDPENNRHMDRKYQLPQHSYSHLDGELEGWQGESNEFDNAGSSRGWGSTRYGRGREQDTTGSSKYDERPYSEQFPFGEPVTYLRKIPKDLPTNSDTSEFLYGYNMCRLALKMKRRKIYKLHVYQGTMRMAQSRQNESVLTKLAERLGIPVEGTQNVSLLDAMSKGRPHNGFALEAEPLEVPEITNLSAVRDGKFNAPIKDSTGYVHMESQQEGRKPFVLVLDELLDGGNFGAILRSAYFLGVDAVVICSKNSTPATAMTSRASAGALECINFYHTRDLKTFIEKSQQAHWKFFGAMAAPSETTLRLSKTKKATKWYDMEGLGDPLHYSPVALVMGNEAEGLREGIRKLMDGYVTIRKGEAVDEVVDSLNVGVAASILTNAFLNPAVKKAKPEPAMDGKTIRRATKREEQRKVKEVTENLMFTMDDGKYEAPRYEGVNKIEGGVSVIDQEEEDEDLVEEEDKYLIEKKNEDWKDILKETDSIFFDQHVEGQESVDEDLNEDEDEDSNLDLESNSGLDSNPDSDSDWDSDSDSGEETSEPAVEEPAKGEEEEKPINNTKAGGKRLPKEYMKGWEEMSEVDKALALYAFQNGPPRRIQGKNHKEELILSLTKKQKKQMKKAKKKDQIALRKKVREDKTKMTAALNQRRDPRILKEIESKKKSQAASEEKRGGKGKKNKEKEPRIEGWGSVTE